jgi:hypothetical protein
VPGAGVSTGGLISLPAWVIRKSCGRWPGGVRSAREHEAVRRCGRSGDERPSGREQREQAPVAHQPTFAHTAVARTIASWLPSTCT